MDSRSRSGPLPALPHSTIPMCFPTSTSVQQPGCDSQQHHSSTEDRSPASPLAQRTHTTPLTPPSVVPAPQCLCGFFEAQNPFPPQHLALPLMTAWPVPSLSFPRSFAFQHWCSCHGYPAWPFPPASIFLFIYKYITKCAPIQYISWLVIHTYYIIKCVPI